MYYFMVLCVCVGIMLIIVGFNKFDISFNNYKLSNKGALGIGILLVGAMFIGIASQTAGLICAIVGVVLLILPFFIKKVLPDVFYIVICVLTAGVVIFSLFFALSMDSEQRKRDDMLYHYEIFNKDPNTWTKDEEEYVNNFFEWQAKNY